MTMFLLFLAIAIIPCVIYAVIVLLEVPGMAEERLGVLEDLPEDAGEWKADTASEAARAAADDGLIRETRLWIDTSGALGREKIYRQARYRDRDTGDVVRAEKDVRIRRRRVRPS